MFALCIKIAYQLNKLNIGRKLVAKVCILETSLPCHVARESAKQLALTLLERTMEDKRYQINLKNSEYTVRHKKHTKIFLS